MRNGKIIALGRQFAALVLSAVCLPAAAHAVGFTMTPASVAADYAGMITLNITDVTPGQTVVVETLVDTNGTGGELLVQSFQVTDGSALTIGGKRYSSVPGDEDGVADGNILVRLNFQGLSEMAKGIGSFIYRISPASGGFAPVVSPFSVTQLAQAQKIVGQVTSGLAPVPFAYVFLMTPTSDGPLVGAIADAGGNFTLHAAEGTYTVGALQSGVLLDFNAAPQVTLPAGATVPQNLSLGAPNRTIAGRLTDAASGVGLAGVLMTAETGELGLLGLGFSDANGNFTIAVSDAAAQWVLYPSEKSAALLGYLLATDGYQVDIAGGSVSDVAIPLPKATALIWGTLTVDQGPPLAGVSICADNRGQYESCVVTDSGGNYVAGVVAGTWNIGADRNDLAARGYLGQGAQVTVGAGQALRQDLLARQPTAHLIGRVVDDSNPPNAVANICISAFPGQGEGVDGQTDADGYFSLGVVAGTWQLSVCSEDAQQRGLVPPSLSYTVSDGVDTTGILYVAKRKTTAITGHVQDNTNTPLAGVGVNAYINLGGTVYNSWQQTDASGNFSLGVINGPAWQVSLNCSDLGPRGYACPGPMIVTVPSTHQVANFTVPPYVPLQITTTSLPPAQVGVFFTTQFQATGGQAPYTWSFVDLLAQPPGLNLSPDGTLSGTPFVPGIFNFTVRVTDSVGAPLDKDFSLQINAAPVPCVGDCDANGRVTVDEILAMVNIALGNPPTPNCQAGDPDTNGQITVDEIVTAVRNALNGC
ncbi:MAG: multidomain protein with s-layer y region, glug motif, ig motif, i-set domain, pkd domain [Deltaproteobacteria bacterium]|nr:multidomain protein with s-layer y region, glug motif, ig motif, i-set domain, pkd domain [Deltaproteobacteria bacterium]